MIPAFVAKMGPVCTAPMDHAATGMTLSVTVDAKDVVEAMTVLDAEGYLLEDVMASDLQEGYEITYHLSLLDGANRIVVRALVPHDAPSLPTISTVYPGADWHERECFDFYGIDFAGHPNLHYLLLPENFGSHPLIKEEKSRKSLADLMPLGYLVDCGLAEPEAEKPKPAKVVKAAKTEDA